MADLTVADLSPAQREVWQAEQDYWVLTRDKDVDGFMALTHDRVAVWPAVARLPLDRAALHAQQKTRVVRDAISAYDLVFHTIAVHGDAAIVYYTVTTTGEGPAPARIGSLITHTWIKADGKWKLAGGMSRRLAT